MDFSWQNEDIVMTKKAEKQPKKPGKKLKPKWNSLNVKMEDLKWDE